MKVKKIKKTLSLNKLTISNLDDKENVIKGGYSNGICGAETKFLCRVTDCHHCMVAIRKR